jgi:hypothetical protein
MIEFTAFLLRRAKESKLIPYNDFLAIARGKEGKLLDFFLSIKDTGIVELTADGLKVVATPELLKTFKTQTYKISSPFTDFNKYSIFDLNRKAKKLNVLALRILDYVKNNIGCDFNDLRNQFNTSDFRDSYTTLLNEGLIAFYNEELFVAIEDKEYQLLLVNLKNNGITLDAPVNEQDGEKVELEKCCVKVFGRDFEMPLDLEKTPEKLIYDFYMSCENPQDKVYLREKRAYLLNYPSLIEEKSAFKMINQGKAVELKFAAPLKAQIEKFKLSGGYHFETEFYFKSFK